MLGEHHVHRIVETATEILDTTLSALPPVLEQFAWGEDEITEAMQRHPHAADTLHHSFTLLFPTSDRMNTEFVYRRHCQELLDQVANGEDSRPGTAVEVVIALYELALATPINAASTGLVFRMWATAFPDQQEIDVNRQHREKLHGSSIDDAEAVTRAQLAIPDRTLGTIECSGHHHGEQVWRAPTPATPPARPPPRRTRIRAHGCRFGTPPFLTTDVREPK